MSQASELSDLLPEFFCTYGGTIRNTEVTVRANHQNPEPPGDGTLTCLTVDVVFGNRGVFGTTGPFLSDVFPRYRFLGSELTRFLAQHEIAVNSPASSLLFDILPSVAPSAVLGDALPKLDRPSRGALTPTIGELAERSPYYRRLASRYRVEYGLITSNGTVIGPDGGILATATAVAESFQRPISVVELGTGAASTVTALAHLGKLAGYRGNDFSPEMGVFFESRIRPMLESTGIPGEVVVAPSHDYPLYRAEADLVIVGIYYEAQPDLILGRGGALASCLKDCGVLVMQSGKPENPFITRLLTNPDGSVSPWPWYRAEFSLHRLFSRVEIRTVEDEVMVIAANDSEVVDGVLNSLQA